MRLRFEQFWLWLRYRDKRARVIQSLRYQMRALGIPCDHLADEEVEYNVQAMSQAMANLGVSVAELSEAMQRAASSGLFADPDAR